MRGINFLSATKLDSHGEVNCHIVRNDKAIFWGCMCQKQVVKPQKIWILFIQTTEIRVAMCVFPSPPPPPSLSLSIYIYIYIYIYQMDCVCQRYHKECSTRTCADDCYDCWKKYIWLEFGLFSTIIYIYIFVDTRRHHAVLKKWNFDEYALHSIASVVFLQITDCFLRHANQGYVLNQ